MYQNAQREKDPEFLWFPANHCKAAILPHAHRWSRCHTSRINCFAHSCFISTWIIITGIEWMMFCTYGVGWNVSTSEYMFYLHKYYLENIFGFEFIPSLCPWSRIITLTSIIDAWCLRNPLMNILYTHDRIHWSRQPASIKMLVLYHGWFCTL